MQKQHTQAQTPVARSAFLFGSGTLTSRILGLFRDYLMLTLLPLDVKDAWIAAWRLPNFFRRFLGEGGLSVSLIPQYVKLLRAGDEQERQALVNGLFSLLVTFVLVLCLLLFLFMEPVMSFVVGGKGFVDVPGKLELTIALARIMVFFLFFITLFAYFMALLNGNGRFARTGYAPLFLNLVIISAYLLFRGSEDLVHAVSWAVVVGGAVQAFFLFPGIVVIKQVPRFTFNMFGPPVIKVLKRFAPTVVGVGALQILTIINTYFASHLQPGALSHIYIGDRLLELPLSLIAVSIGTALLPTLSGYWKEQDVNLFCSSLSRQMSLFFFLGLPSALGLWILGFDIADILFRRGEFTLEEARVVSGILKVYSLTLLMAGTLKIVNQGLYAMGDTLTPALISLVGIGVHLFLAPQLMALYGIYGLVGSTLTITSLNLALSLFFLQKRSQWLLWKIILGHGAKCLLAAGVMALFLWQIQKVGWRQDRFITDAPLLLVIVAASAILYFLIASILKVDELESVKRRFLKRR